eukprot:COSAG02_NODE_431_length_22447_cov_7.487202_3_plen_154_part_00
MLNPGSTDLSGTLPAVFGRSHFVGSFSLCGPVGKTVEFRRHDRMRRSEESWGCCVGSYYSVFELVVVRCLLPNCAYCARLGVSTFHWFLSARNLSLNFFGTDCAQVFNFPSCPNVRNTHGSVGSTVLQFRCGVLRFCEFAPPAGSAGHFRDFA